MTASDSDTKTCPACAETIKTDATRCKHCAYDLDAPQKARNRRIFWTGMIALAIALLAAFSAAKAWTDAGDKTKREIECIKAGVSPHLCD